MNSSNTTSIIDKKDINNKNGFGGWLVGCVALYGSFEVLKCAFLHESLCALRWNEIRIQCSNLCWHEPHPPAVIQNKVCAFHDIVFGGECGDGKICCLEMSSSVVCTVFTLRQEGLLCLSFRLLPRRRFISHRIPRDPCALLVFSAD